jgi:hypothetical protein
MIRRFCDGCEREIKVSRRSNRILRENGRIKVEVLVAVDGCWNGGDVCAECVQAAVNMGRDVNPVVGECSA